MNGDAVSGSAQSRLLVARNKTRQRWQPAMRLSDVLLEYLGDAADDPSPIKLIEAGGKTNLQGQVLDSESREIREHFQSSPIAKAYRARFNWVAMTDEAKFTRDSEKMR